MEAAMFPEFHPTYISVEPKEGAACVCLKPARLSDELNIELLGRELFALVEQFGARKVAVSMRNVEHATSAALGKLITLNRKLHRNGGTLVLCDMGEDMRDIMRASRLLNYFKTAPNLDAALESLR
jgi:anti-sigma B factor antagonist